jgi:RNA polymerase sigma factor (sigma-70 family)
MPIDQTSWENFERLLAWLELDQEKAGEKYEQIRRNLLDYFRRHGALDPLSLADEVFVRVTRKVDAVAPNFVGDPYNYFLAVARNVLAEWRRQPGQAELPADIPVFPDDGAAELKETLLQGLEHCWEQLSVEEQENLLRYYLETPTQKLYESREQLARDLGVTLNALRVMTHRLRSKLKHCIEKSVSKKKKMK